MEYKVAVEITEADIADGIPEQDIYCPTAGALYRVFPLATKIYVAYDNVTVHYAGIGDDKLYWIPEALSAQIHAFDDDMGMRPGTYYIHSR